MKIETLTPPPRPPKDGVTATGFGDWDGDGKKDGHGKNRRRVRWWGFLKFAVIVLTGVVIIFLGKFLSRY